MKSNRRPLRLARLLWLPLTLSLLLGLGGLTLGLRHCPSKSCFAPMVLTPDEAATARGALPGN